MGAPANVYSFSKPETKPIDKRAEQIRTLKNISRSMRDSFYGPQWYEQSRQLFELTTAIAATPSWRPTVHIPQLQTLLMKEATDLASVSPRVLVTKFDKSGDEKQDEDRQAALEAQWRQMQTNLVLLYGELWSMFCGTGWLQLQLDSYGNHGNGQLALEALDPSRVFPDPFVKDLRKASFLIIEATMSRDEIMAKWGSGGKGPAASINFDSASPTGALIPQTGDNPPYPVQTLFGPSLPRSEPEAAQIGSPPASQIEVNICLCKDYTQSSESSQKKKSRKLGQTGIDIPGSQFQYPWGRALVEVNGTIVYDDRNPWGGLGGKLLYNVVPIHAMPNLTAIWAPPPTRFTLPIQTLSERICGQIYENIYRTNNCITYVPANSGISDDFMVLPGEIQWVAAGADFPKHVYANAMPEYATKWYRELLEIQRDLIGYPDARQGDSGAGNIGADVFDASIGAASKMTQMRTMLLQDSLQTLVELTYYSMCRFLKNSTLFPVFQDKEGEFAEWTPFEGSPDREGRAWIHPGSIRLMSQSNLTRFVLGLRQAGLISRKQALIDLDYPNAERISEELDAEEQLAALAKVKKR
jgi:hypothetical protein